MAQVERQRDVFLGTEGDRYFQRNRVDGEDLARRAAQDPLLCALVELGFQPRRVLEIGSGDGWRLDHMRRLWPGVHCSGLDPSLEAIAAGGLRFPELELRRGTAEALPYDDGAFDLVALGFCLYLCDREDLFRIAAEVDRVLTQPGRVAIFDFHAERAHRNPYHHRDGLASYKMNYARLFDWNPAYTVELARVFAHGGGEVTVDNALAVHVLQRDLEAAWTERGAGPRRGTGERTGG